MFSRSCHRSKYIMRYLVWKNVCVSDQEWTADSCMASQHFSALLEHKPVVILLFVWIRGTCWLDVVVVVLLSSNMGVLILSVTLVLFSFKLSVYSLHSKIKTLEQLQRSCLSNSAVCGFRVVLSTLLWVHLPGLCHSCRCVINDDLHWPLRYKQLEPKGRGYR